MKRLLLLCAVPLLVGCDYKEIVTTRYVNPDIVYSEDRAYITLIGYDSGDYIATDKNVVFEKKLPIYEVNFTVYKKSPFYGISSELVITYNYKYRTTKYTVIEYWYQERETTNEMVSYIIGNDVVAWCDYRNRIRNLCVYRIWWQTNRRITSVGMPYFI